MDSIGSTSLCAYVMTCNHMCTCVCVWGVQAKHQGVHGSQRCTRTIVEIQHGLELGPIVTPTAFCNLQMEAEGVKDSLRCKMGSSGHSGIPWNTQKQGTSVKDCTGFLYTFVHDSDSFVTGTVGNLPQQHSSSIIQYAEVTPSNQKT